MPTLKEKRRYIEYKHNTSIIIIILDYADKSVPIILSRSFFKVGGTLVDVYKGTIILSMNDQPIEFNMNEGMKYPQSLGGDGKPTRCPLIINFKIFLIFLG